MIVIVAGQVRRASEPQQAADTRTYVMLFDTEFGLVILQLIHSFIFEYKLIYTYIGTK